MTDLVSVLSENHRKWAGKAFPSVWRLFDRDAKTNIKSNVEQWLRVAEDIQMVDTEYCTEGWASDEGESKSVLRFTGTKGETVRLFFINDELDDIVPY